MILSWCYLAGFFIVKQKPPEQTGGGRGESLVPQANFSIIEQIKQSADTETLCKQYLGLSFTSKGRRKWALCPVHGEKTASLCLFPDGKLKCFGCHFTGDGFDIIAAVTGEPLAAVIRKVAADLGIQADSGADRGEWRRQIENAKAEQTATVEIRESLTRVFLAVAAMGREIDSLLRTYEEYERYVDLVHMQPVIEGILDDMLSPDPEQQADGYLTARRRFPWLQ
jgi:DNA primase